MLKGMKNIQNSFVVSLAKDTATIMGSFYFRRSSFTLAKIRNSPNDLKMLEKLFNKNKRILRHMKL